MNRGEWNRSRSRQRRRSRKTSISAHRYLARDSRPSPGRASQKENTLSRGKAVAVAAPVVYKDLVLVLATSDGVAALTFAEEIRDLTNQRFGLNYRFRYQAKGAEKVETGSGKVFETGGGSNGELFISAGPIKLKWSNGGPGKGWIYYIPDRLWFRFPMPGTSTTLNCSGLPSEPRLASRSKSAP